MSRREHEAAMVDELSLDGRNPLPTIEELDAMDRAALINLKVRVLARAGELKTDVASASARFATGGPPLPRVQLDALHRTRNWYQRLGQLIQEAERLQSARLKAERTEQFAAERAEIQRNRESNARLFMAAARRMLPNEMFQAIWAEVHRGKENG